MADNNLQNLLHQVSIINKKYEEIAAVTGENYNIFKILGLTKNEVRTHSAFVADLLNPKGAHGLKDLPIQHFLKEIKFNSDFETSECTVEVEKHVGNINETKDEGGRIDIIITDKKNNCLIIENKLFAIDQPNQLTRYYNYNKNAHLIYLTLDGKEADENTLKGMPEDKKMGILRISYADKIINWLELVKKEAVNHSILRETITQYIYLLKFLTNQSTNKNMSDDIVNTISFSTENLSAAFSIRNNLEAVKYHLFNSVFLNQLRSVCEKLDLKLNEDAEISICEEEVWFKITNDKWDYFDIIFEFEGKGNRELMLGICLRDKERPNNEVFEELKLHYKGNIENWGIWNEFPTYSSWGDDAMIAIINGEMIKKFKEEIEKTLSKTKDLKM